MHNGSLAISGLRIGPLALLGFSGPIGAPDPPSPATVVFYGTLEVGSAMVAGLMPGNSMVVIGPFQTTDRDQMQVKVHSEANIQTHLNYEFSTDKGTTWYVGQQIVSATVTHDDANGYTNEAHGHFELGYWWRVSVYNRGATTGNVSVSWRLHSF